MPADRAPLGPGWDHSYNIYLELGELDEPGSPITIHDGNARPQRFYQDPSGSWTAPRYHRSGEFDEQGRFVLTFADGGQWIFRSAQESGQTDILEIWRIIDRQGNRVELEYDALDRLARVVNSAGQSLELEYDAEGHIDGVVAKLDDLTERRVSYEYYGADDAKGERFDLRAVQTPAILDTPTGNDFPAGTTTVYTYSKAATPELAGNLLTIEDALGQVILRNTYAPTTDPGDFEFDRLIHQQWGDAGDLLSMRYAKVTPSAANGFADTKAWLNDRMGRVSEHFFDAANQRVMLREYTGFADPDLATDDLDNRPKGKLRPADPTYFETRYNYNVDGHIRLVVQPRGNAIASVYEGDLDPSAPARTRGNLRERHRQGLTCASGEPPITELYEYQPGRGNEHGEREFVTRARDPRGSVTEATYDLAGNRTSIVHPAPDTREDMEYSEVGQMTRHILPADQHGHRRELVYEYGADGRTRDTTVDPQGFALRTTREYDAACNEVRRVDPRGNDKLYVYNQHDQLIREWGPLETCSAACGGGTPTRAATDRILDANMNVVRVDYQALECDGSAQANPTISTAYEYDRLNELTATRTEIGPDEEVVERFELDANREVRVLAKGEATAGTDPHATLTTIYDERGLVYREIEAQAAAIASTTQHDYDLNGNEIALHVGLEGPTRTTQYTYDCADRLVAVVDPMGNRSELELDAAGNVVEQRTLGELVDLPGSANNLLLERVTNAHDSMNRIIEITRDHFDPGTQAPIGDGESSSAFVYDGESRVVLEADDNGHYITHDFDSAGRALETIDAVGNIVEFGYDANSNVLTRTIIDMPSGGGLPQIGVWTNTYDAQNNLIEAVDSMGEARHNCYDSLGNLVETLDPRGNRTKHEYDGAGRLLATAYTLTEDGAGAGAVIGLAVTAQAWDANDRLIAREDPDGNVTEYAFDSRGRLIHETFADGASQSFEYDVHGDLVGHKDALGTVTSTTYDALGRAREVAIDVGAGVNAATTFERFAYDGRSALVRATDDDSDVTRRYDSLGALLTETQTLGASAYALAYARDGVGNPTKTWYPGGRRIDRSFEGRRRTSRIEEDNTTLVEFEYQGPSVQRKVFVAVGVQSDYTYDLVRRMIRSEHIEIGGDTIDAREYGFDEAGNKRSEHDLGPQSPTGLRTMAHDSLGRMVDSEVSGSAATDRVVEYGFDGAGNRTTVSGDACPGPYTLAGSDALINQYSQTPCEDWSVDLVGNLMESQATGGAGRDRRFEYDHRGRLVKVTSDPGGGQEVRMEFAYDALGRKLQTTRIDASSVVPERYVYDDWNVIEEYSGQALSPSVTYLYGEGLDERLQRVSGQAWWYLDDELGSVSALVGREDLQPDTLVVERYAYQDYGEPTFLTAPLSGNPYLFTGARWLAESGLYDLRTRYLDASSGRFISRDSLGIWGDEENLGNGFSYVGNMPDTHTDPLGESKKPVVKNCHAGAGDDIEAALEVGEGIANFAKNWFDREAAKKRKSRKQDWNNRKHDGRLWWGQYSNSRFHRLEGNYHKILRRCQKNVITFKCRSSGSSCAGKDRVAWTLSTWHSQIRLCKSEDHGFFRSSGALRFSVENSGRHIMHEITHNINAIGDMKLNGKVAYSATEAQRLGRQQPTRASWNAGNHDQFAGSFNGGVK